MNTPPLYIHIDKNSVWHIERDGKKILSWVDHYAGKYLVKRKHGRNQFTDDEVLRICRTVNWEYPL